MNRRLVKQILYGAGYLTVFFLLVLGVYLLWFKPAPTCFDNKQNQGETGIDCGGPCASCELKTLVNLQSPWLKYFSTDGGVIIAAEIKNSNQNYGADYFSYTLDIFGDNGVKLKSITDNSFIYSGEIKYVVQPTDINYQDIRSVQISFSGVNWKSKDEFPKPTTQIRGWKTEAAADNSGISVSGFISNQNAFPLSKMRIIAFLDNASGTEISVSKTELENIAAFEETTFKINFPKNVSLMAVSAGPSYNFTRDLTIGSTGQDVQNLQTFLKEQGFFNREVSNYFGSITQQALIQYQKKTGISPASGYFGPKTRNYINSLVSAAPTTNLTQADPSKTKIYVETIR